MPDRARLLTQILEEARPGEIDFVPIGTLTATIVDRCIDITRLLELEVTIAPPPIHKLRIDGFVIDPFAVGGKRFVEPGLKRLVVRHGVEPPLVCRLVRGNCHEIILGCVVIKIEVIPADEVQPGELHAIVEVALHGSKSFMTIRTEALVVHLHGFHCRAQHCLTGRVIQPKVITVYGNIANGLLGNLEVIAHGEGKSPTCLQDEVTAHQTRRSA